MDTVLTMKDSRQEAILKMAEGNPGALNVLLMLCLGESPLTGFSEMLRLDSLDIRGPKIWVGYKDVCGKDLEVFRDKIKKSGDELKKAIASNF